MKLKYIIASFVAAVATLTGCTQLQPVSELQGLTVSNDYFTLDSEEGSVNVVTISGEEDWSISYKAEWLSVTPMSGVAGQDVDVTFQAVSASSAARKVEVTVKMGGKTKIINVNQAAPEGVEVPLATCKEVIDGGDGTYKVRGTVTSIVNTSYGNWYLADATGEIYIYGTFNAKSQYPKDADGGWASFGIEVGDIVTVEGPRTVYSGTVELVDVSIVKIEKSKISVDPFDFDKLPCEGGTFNMKVSAKESPLLVHSSASWLTLEGVNPDGSFLLRASENPRTAERTATISIKGPTAMKSVTVTQEGQPATGATVSDIIATEDGSAVQTLPSTIVVALTTKGAVLSDGTKAIYAYGNAAAALSLGDGVKMSATKTTYNGVPELTDITEVFVDSQGNAVKHPNATDITSAIADYNAETAVYVKFTGTLSVSGNYFNITFDGIDPETRQGSIVYPVDALDAKSFDGKKITVTGYFNGISGKGKYVNVIATKIVEYDPTAKGSVANPYTASEIAKLLTTGTTFDEDVYIKGKVSAVLYTFSASYGTGTFWISDDGTAYGVSDDKKSTSATDKDFECYSVYWFNNKPWAEGNPQIAVGDEVIVCGKTAVYNGIAETSGKNAWVYSHNGVTE